MKRFILASFFVFLLSQDYPNLGTDNSLDFATWNLEWFPKNNQITVNYVTDIIEQMDLDIIAIQELNNTEMFDDMLDNLPAYTGYYESSWFAGLAYIYKTDVIEVNDIYEIYITSPYWNAFPRSPMVMDVNFMGQNYIFINNHFKCCGDGILNFNNDSDEELRRLSANNLLKYYIDYNLSNKNVIVLGDLNDDIAEPPQNNVFQTILDDADNYRFVDMDIANGSSSNWSYPTWPSHLDHILITNELFDELDNSDVQTIKLDQYLNGGWNEYDNNISDHRPVFMKLVISSIPGDVNSDNLINILDVVLIVQIIIGNESSLNSADFNQDGQINIIDVVQLLEVVINN